MHRSFLSLTALITLPVILPTLPDTVAHAAEGQLNPAQAIRSCSAIADNDQRLACFDRLAQDLEQNPGLTLGAESVLSKTAQEPTAKDDTFGLPAKSVTAQDDMERQTTIAAVRKKVHGTWVLTMENDQIWEQADTARIATPSAGDAVTISKSPLGGFFITINGRSIRAKRVQ